MTVKKEPRDSGDESHGGIETARGALISVTEDTPKLGDGQDAVSPVSPLLVAALAWLDIGAALIPCQPGRKHQVAGFGAHLRKVTTADEAHFWFDERRANLAVACGIGDVLALDFDSWRAFADFDGKFHDLTETLTEQSRRGVHLYYLCSSADRVRSCTMPGPGFEVKASGGAIMVAPSVVARTAYRTVTIAPLMRCDDLPARLSLSLLSELKPSVSLEGKGGDVVARCKATLDLLALAQALQRMRGIGAPWKLSPDGGWWRSCCPFHGPESNPSFMVNLARGFYQCLACGERGDSLNLYMVVHGLPDIHSTIVEVARRLP